MEGLAILEENMVMAALVNRDFSNDVAQYGDVVNTRRPGNFVNYRKVDTDSVTAQDASATNVPVSLNMHNYINFTIKDGEASKSFKDLVAVYLRPGAIGIANGIDRMLAGQAQRFQTNASGILGGVTSSTAKDYLLEARQTLNENKAHMQGRNLVLGPASETLLLQTDMFTKANERGDGGKALEDARLGRILGFDTFMDQNAGGLSSKVLVDYVAGTINDANGIAAETVNAITVAVAGHEASVGEFINFAENGQLTYCLAVTTGGGNTTSINIDSGLKYALANASALDCHVNCNTHATYASGYVKAIVLRDYTATKVPRQGQLLAWGATAALRHTYTIIEAYENPSDATQTIVYLDRALEKTVTAADPAFPGPVGGLNLAFHKDAIALVSRPLAMPQGAGVSASVLNYNDVSMRVAMQYDIASQGTKVTLDLLCGVAVLDTNLGCCYYT